MDAVEESTDTETGVACQTSVAMVDAACQTCEREEDNTGELQQLEQREASQKSENSFCADALKSNEQKLKFYTGQ